MTSSTEDMVPGGKNPEPGLPAQLTPGQILAEARQRLGLSVGDIAAKLRMSVVQIDAMERADYEKLPKGTFLRGFVRSYAKLVGLDPEAILTRLEETHADSRKPSIVVPTQNIALSAPGERYNNPRAQALLALTLLLAICAGAAYWWFEVRPGKVAPIARAATKLSAESSTLPAPPPAVADTVAQSSPVPVVPTADPAVVQASSTTVMPAPSTSTVNAPSAEPAHAVPQAAPLTQTTAPLQAAPASASPAVAKPVVPKGSGSLRFAFSGESWVEVVDAGGKTLLSRRFQSGQGETVVGKLPISVVIGNATVTRMQFNEVDFDLTPHTRVAVARFTLK